MSDSGWHPLRDRAQYFAINPPAVFYLTLAYGPCCKAPRFINLIEDGARWKKCGNCGNKLRIVV